MGSTRGSRAWDGVSKLAKSSNASEPVSWVTLSPARSNKAKEKKMRRFKRQVCDKKKMRRFKRQVCVKKMKLPSEKIAMLVKYVMDAAFAKKRVMMLMEGLFKTCMCGLVDKC
jgi:hypothetical protein